MALVSLWKFLIVELEINSVIYLDAMVFHLYVPSMSDKDQSLMTKGYHVIMGSSIFQKFAWNHSLNFNHKSHKLAVAYGLRLTEPVICMGV